MSSMLIETDRLLVRRLMENDTDALFAVLSDTEVMRYIEPTFSREQTQAFIRNAGSCEPPLVYAVVWKQTAEVIGHLIWHPWDETAMELGWILHRNFWGRGIAKELTAAMLARADKDVILECSTAQTATRRIAEDFGFCADAVSPERIIFKRRVRETMRFENVYFINGTAYAGKSTLVRGLAQKYDGIACEENYHDRLLPGLDPAEFPCLCYTRDLVDWHDFIRRTPEAYEAWYDGVTRECETLELRILPELAKQGRPVFVDTNIRPETLKIISDPRHVLMMLAEPEISVRRFFERPDPEKQFLYRLLLEEPDPKQAMENYRQGLMRINSRERYDRFLHSGFQVLLRNENRSAEQTLKLAEQALGLSSPEP